MSEKNKSMDDTQPIRQDRRAFGCLRLILFIFVVVIAVILGASFEPLTNFVSETVALLTNSRLPDSSSRLEFSLTTPRDLIVTFDEETTGIDLRWSGSSWRPSSPLNSHFSYEVSVFAADNTIISSLSIQ